MALEIDQFLFDEICASNRHNSVLNDNGQFKLFPKSCSSLIFDFCVLFNLFVGFKFDFIEMNTKVITNDKSIAKMFPNLVTLIRLLEMDVDTLIQIATEINNITLFSERQQPNSKSRKRNLCKTMKEHKIRFSKHC